jgi:polyhydroxyalkanoate synthesis regulator phasin
MKKMLKIAGAITVIALVGAIAFGAVALAQGATTAPGLSAKSVLPWLGGLIGGKGSTVSGYEEQFLNTLASKLGVERSKLDQAVTDARKEVIEQAVKDGKITEEQANWMLDPQAAMKAQVEQMVADGKLTQEQADWLLQGVEKGYVPGGKMVPGNRLPFGGRGTMPDRGGMPNGRGQKGQVTPTPAPSGTKG